MSSGRRYSSIRCATITEPKQFDEGFLDLILDPNLSGLRINLISASAVKPLILLSAMVTILSVLQP